MFHFGSVVLSVLVYRHWFLQVLAFTGKLPYSGAYLKTCFPREEMIALLLGSFSVPVFTNIINSKKNIQNESCKY